MTRTVFRVSRLPVHRLPLTSICSNSNIYKEVGFSLSHSHGAKTIYFGEKGLQCSRTTVADWIGRAQNTTDQAYPMGKIGRKPTNRGSDTTPVDSASSFSTESPSERLRTLFLEPVKSPH